VLTSRRGCCIRPQCCHMHDALYNHAAPPARPLSHLRRSSQDRGKPYVKLHVYRRWAPLKATFRHRGCFMHHDIAVPHDFDPICTSVVLSRISIGHTLLDLGPIVLIMFRLRDQIRSRIKLRMLFVIKK